MLVAAAAIAWIAWHGLRREAEPGFIVGFEAAAGDTAVIVWRANHDHGPATSWIARVDANGRVAWTKPIPRVAMSVGGTGAVTIVDGIAVVRYGQVATDGYTVTDSAAIAFDLADGHVLWDRVLAHYEPHAIEGYGTSRLDALPLYISDLAVGKQLVSFADTGKGIVATGTEARTGAVLWTRPSSSESIDGVRYSPIVFGDRYALHASQTATVSAGATGESHEISTNGTGCEVSGEYITVERRGGSTAALVAYSSTAAARVIAEPFDLFDGWYSVRSCGHYGERLVFLIETHTRDDTRATQVVITDRVGKVLHRIVLAFGGPIMSDTTMKVPARATLGGELPRFVPYPEDEYKPSGDSVSTLVMLDLETGTIAWRAQPDRRLLFGGLFRAGTRWIWSDGELSPTLAVFDGTTGTLAGAVTAYSYDGIYSISLFTPKVATPDTLWIFSGEWASPDQAPIATIDLATMKTRFARDVKLTNVTAEVKAKLGL